MNPPMLCAVARSAEVVRPASRARRGRARLGVLGLAAVLAAAAASGYMGGRVWGGDPAGDPAPGAVRPADDRPGRPAAAPAAPAAPRDGEDRGWTLYDAPPWAGEARLVADWEATHAALVAWSPLWASGLDELLAALTPAGEVYLVATAEADPGDMLRRTWPFRGHRIHLPALRVDTAWTRDWGPFQVRTPDGLVRWVRPKYASFRPLDAAFTTAFAALQGVPVEQPDFDMDGGAVVADGHGLCVMTADNLELSGTAGAAGRAARDRLMTRLGCRWILSVPGLPGERTQHADMFVQFLGPDSVAVAAASDPEGAPAVSRAMTAVRAGLLGAYSAMGRAAPAVADVPTPPAPPQPGDEAEVRRYFSYINGVRLGRRHIVPHYAGAPAAVEAQAHRAIAAALPAGVELVSIPADSMLAADGALHCTVLALASPADGAPADGPPASGTSAAAPPAPAR